MEPKVLKVKLDLLEVENKGAQLSSGSSVSSTGGQQKKRKAVVRKESAATQAYGSSQQNDMDADMEENKEEISFFSSGVSDSAG